MKIIKQLFIILLFYLIGEMISLGIRTVIPHLFIPGTILGMVLLLIILMVGLFKLEQVEQVGSFLTSNMSFFFIPTVVGVVEYFDILKPIFLKILIICTFSALLTLFATIYVVRLTIKMQAKFFKRQRNDNNS